MSGKRICGLALLASAFAHDVGAWQVTQDYRLRYESVSDDAFRDDSDALTLRGRLGLRTDAWRGFTAFAEADIIVAADRNSYNSTINNERTRPAIPDPAGEEINQAYVAYGFGTPSQWILGRQRLNYDNQRFVGSVGFRQNEQTYDALSVQHTAGALTVRAAYVDEVHRIFGNYNPNPLLRQQDLDTYLINLAYLYGGHQAVAYLYAIENQDVPLSSHRNLGLRFSGAALSRDTWKWLYVVEAAQQDDIARGSSDIDVGYYAIDNTLNFKDGAFALRVLFERLGGNGRYGFQTPLATLHAFNGWADRFLTTPRDGLRDMMFEVSGKLGGGILSARWHEFRSDRGDIDYGDEIGMQYVRPVGTQWTLSGKLARYRADRFGTDLDKIWLTVDYRR